MSFKKVMNKQRPRAMQTFLVLMLLMASLLIVACSESHAKKPKKKNFIQQGDEVHFTLSGESVSIPSAYFKGGSHNIHGLLHHVKLWALLPDFESYDKSENHDEFFEQVGFGRKIYITLSSRSLRPAKVHDIIAIKASGQHRPISGRIGKFDESTNDLEVYYSNTFADDDYLYRLSNETLVYIHCSSKKQKVPHPSCKMLWDISEGIAADAIFSLRYLSEWKTIINRANSLIQTTVN